jgi:glucan phosphoethanolaminetransferase (alkaline phosphatase superfamily)
MLREFFAPRVVMIFVLYFFLIWGMCVVWLKTNKRTHRKWLTHAKAPFVAAVVSFICTAVMAILLQFFN